MPTKLKQLILPQLVEERRKQDGIQCTVEAVEGGNSMFLVDNASVSDITSPATPTFSHRSGLGHLRYSSSTSSIELPLSLPSPSFSECPASSPPAPGHVSSMPLTTPVAHATLPSTAAASKRPLPDVQEEEFLEHVPEEGRINDQHDTGSRDRMTNVYGCLYNESSVYCEPSWDPSPQKAWTFNSDLSFVSDCDGATTAAPTTQRHYQRGGSLAITTDEARDSSFSGLTLRFGSHIHALSRWRGGPKSRQAHVNLTSAPLSEPSLSRAPSSRSSSVSGPQHAPKQTTVLSPDLSFYGSTESIEHIPTGCSTVDAELDEARRSLARDRTKATTPLLPPLFINSPQAPSSPLPPSSLQASPLQSPAIASPSVTPDIIGSPSGTSDANILAMSLSSAMPTSSISAPTEAIPAPVLRRQFSTASFHQTPLTLLHHQSSSQPALEQQDEWSDRLGHANFTIVPKPYCLPCEADAHALYKFRDDWARARTNYAKHLVRTGEHYGTTSKTYMLTEAKWAETEQQWKNAHGTAVAEFRSRSDGHECASLRLFPPHHDISSLVPQILDADGKFPHRGDQDIVGPMDRVACMEREGGALVEKNGVSKLLKGLADRVRMRKP